MLKAMIFNWGDTVMRDFPEYRGPMGNWPRVAVIPGIDPVLTELSKKHLVCLAINVGNFDAD
jgi:hypothetical protein